MELSDKIKHVFVLMLENHSFDNIFAGSKIPGLRVAKDTDYNLYRGAQFHVGSGAPMNMPTDPGHEFEDVVEQLCGKGSSVSHGVYPKINNSGFAYNYATSTSEDTGLPHYGQIGDIMLNFDTEKDLTPTYQLATEFAVCDHWYSSLPGPTWPNRFFVHGGSSAGLDHSPTTEQMAWWETIEGFAYENGSIFDRLNSKGKSWNIYIDNGKHRAGSVAQACSIRNISHSRIQWLDSLIKRLKNNTYKADYTFIEPNYGDITRGTYKEGSSQHPMDGTHGGEALIEKVYEAIRNSSLWEESLLLITYDEHGGFYDSVAPPPATEPGDKTMSKDYNQFGFKFDRYGVRVPAIVISPYIKKGTVSHTTFDHTSVIATLRKVFDIGHLTKRDLKANELSPLLTLSEPRKDCPKKLDSPIKQTIDNTLSQEALAKLDEEPLPSSGNLVGFMFILLKTKIEMSDGSPQERSKLIDEFKALKTRGEARAYAEDVLDMADSKWARE
ncbi:phospholipase C [Alteromonadaceae bacterium 2753L.S.0a.02]|nr:phospholipase C [Alteromonadaceae bacterium 2753L.S.0a.02]